MNLCDINPMRGREIYNGAYIKLARRHPYLQINPQARWCASVLIPSVGNPTFKGRKTFSLPDGAQMVRITSGMPFAAGNGQIGWSFTDNVATVADDVLNSNAYALFANESRTTATRQNVNAGWFYCKGRKEIFLFNATLTGRRVGIEVYIGA